MNQDVSQRKKREFVFHIVGYDAVNLMVYIPSFAFCYAPKDILLHNDNSKKAKNYNFLFRTLLLLK